jgi:hypothetical protein
LRTLESTDVSSPEVPIGVDDDRLAAGDGLTAYARDEGGNVNAEAPQPDGAGFARGTQIADDDIVASGGIGTCAIAERQVVTPHGIIEEAV